MLYLVATPIGNLKDITYRAVETLNSCDYILCEDTRHSQILLKHYNIQKPLKSFHKFSEASKEEQIIQDLLENKNICLISDAGTPGISDPGTRLVKRCVELGIPVSTIPGPCAAVAALSISGLDTDCFQFYGFLPKSDKALKEILLEILSSQSTSICYESPERIARVLETIHKMDAERHLVIGREITKKFEEFLRGTAQQILNHQGEKKFKGEIVLMFSGNQSPQTADWEAMSIEEHVAKIQNQSNIPLNEAIKKVADIRSVSKRQVYNKIHQRKKSE